MREVFHPVNYCIPHPLSLPLPSNCFPYLIFGTLPTLPAEDGPEGFPMCTRFFICTFHSDTLSLPQVRISANHSRPSFLVFDTCFPPCCDSTEGFFVHSLRISTPFPIFAPGVKLLFIESLVQGPSRRDDEKGFYFPLQSTFVHKMINPSSEQRNPRKSKKRRHYDHLPSSL